MHIVIWVLCAWDGCLANNYPRIKQDYLTITAYSPQYPDESMYCIEQCYTHDNYSFFSFFLIQKRDRRPGVALPADGRCGAGEPVP